MTDAEKIAWYEDMLGITEDNDRYVRLKDTYGMSPGATWLLSRLVAAKGRFLPHGVLLDAIPPLDSAKDRGVALNVKVRVAEVNRVLGKGTIENDRTMGYRLSRDARWAIATQRQISTQPVVINIVAETAEQQVHRILNDPNTLPLDAMRVHGAWRAQGG